MSDFKLKHDEDGGFTLSIDTLKDLDNLENIVIDPAYAMDLESGKPLGEVPPYACSIGFHDWKWYEGIFERYWYCETCDKKDMNRESPKKKKT